MSNQAIDTSPTEVNSRCAPLPPITRSYSGVCEASEIGYADCACDKCTFIRLSEVNCFVANDKIKYPAQSVKADFSIGDGENTTHYVMPTVVRPGLIKRARKAINEFFRKR